MIEVTMSNAFVNRQWVFLFVISLLIHLVDGQPSQSDQSVRTISEAVLVDLVVRDKSGRPVLDLTPEEVEIFENGIRQEILNFRLNQDRVTARLTESSLKTSSSPDSPRPALDASSPTGGIDNLMVFALDGLSMEGRLRARDALNHFINTSLDPRTWIAIFLIDQKLRPVVEFSNDPEKLRQSVEYVTSRHMKSFNSLTEKMIRETEEYLDSLEELKAPESISNAPASRPNPTENPWIFIQQMLANMATFQDSLQRQQQGNASLNSLYALVRGLGTQKGRKTLVYLTEGLQIPNNLESLFQVVIGEANRNNVSIYGLDTRGLITESHFKHALKRQQQVSQISRNQQTSLEVFFTMEEMQLVDTTADVLRFNVLGSLEEISVRTGGFFTAETNDLRPAMDRIDEDISAIYELAYIPSDLTYNGRYRKIEVKILRSDVEIQARDGYYAVPPDLKMSVLPFEVPLLQALENPQDGNSLALFNGAFGFHYASDQREHSFVLELPLRDLDFQLDKKEGLVRAHFSMLMLLKDQKGHVVEKFSREYPICGPPERLDQIRESSVTFLRRAELAPGEYLFEGAVIDHRTRKTGAIRDRFTVSEKRSNLGLSHIVIADHTRPLDDQNVADDPLRFRDSIVIPNLTKRITKGQFPNLIFFLNVYPDPDSEAIPRLELEIKRKKNRFALLRPSLPAPDSNGVISFAIGLPMLDFDPGEYSVHVDAVQGDSLVKQTAAFEIAVPKN